MIDHLERPEGLGPVNGYSHVAMGRGRLIAVSGQLPIDSHGALVVERDPLGQARQVFTNVHRALAAAGARPSDLLQLTLYLIDLTDIPSVRAARDEFLGTGQAPASSLVQVAGLVLPGARLEVDALAVLS